MLGYNCRYISLPKRGNAIKENEDNLIIATDIKDSVIKFAVADGATESSFSKEWSCLLVSYFKDYSFDKLHFEQTLKMAAASWQSRVDSISLPWYAELKAEMGAHATFLGITIDRENNLYEAWSIGDCMLFHIRDNKLLQSFPFTRADAFSNTPDLIPSKWQDINKITQKIVSTEGSVMSQDHLILATDAIAAWIFKEIEQAGIPWNVLTALTDEGENTDKFEEWLEQERNTRQIKNDDVTLILINFT